MKTIINTPKAPAPVGPYNQAVKVGNMLFTSGQIALDPLTGKLNTSSIIEETKLVMSNIKAILEEAGMNLSNVVKTSIFIKDMNQFTTINEVYGSYFTEEEPARETVEVSRLPKDVNIEISVIASK